MTLIQGLLYGLVSGFTELLPVSSQAHQALLFRLFGIDSREPLRDLLIHFAVLLALFIGCKSLFARIRREYLISTRRKRGRRILTESTYELRLVRGAAVPMLLVFLIYLSTKKMESNITTLALLFTINGIVLIVPEYMRQANKDASAMSGLDAILIGILAGLSALPGISRIAMINSYGILRGADKQKVLNWAYLLSIPALLLLCLFDVVFIFTAGVGTITFIVFLGHLLSAAFAFLGAYLSIIFVRFLTVRTGYSGFAYYCWGTALFALILYLIV